MNNNNNKKNKFERRSVQSVGDSQTFSKCKGSAHIHLKRRRSRRRMNKEGGELKKIMSKLSCVVLVGIIADPFFQSREH